MTGFAFYSCEDVVDNPAQDPAQSWNYSVSVKFADFDFNGAVDENSVPYTYKAPTTLYVLNEENTLMGTITTDAAPAIGDYGTYAGTLTGSIGNNLIITTKIGNDLGKQDGTLKSAIENGIVQTAEVPIKIYNANSGTLTTASAKMDNTAAIAYTSLGYIKGGDKILFVEGNQTFEWTVNEEFDPYTSTDLYIALPMNTDPETEYTISSDSKDGYTRGGTFKLADYPTLAAGKVSNYIGGISFIQTGVDLTKWDAYMRTDPNNTWYMNNINNGWPATFSQEVEDGKSFIVTQSGPTLDSLNVVVGGVTGKEVNVTLNNIRLGKDRSINIGDKHGWVEYDGTHDIYGWGAKANVTLIGENECETLYIQCPATKKGEGTLNYKNLSIDSYGSGYYTGGSTWVFTKAGAPTITLNEDMNLNSIIINDGVILNIADNKKINVSNEKAGNYAISASNSEITIGENAEVKAIAAKNASGLYTNNTTVTIKDNARVITKTTGTGGSGFDFNGSDKKLTIGKNVTIEAIGTPDNWSRIGYGMVINTTGEVTIGDGSKIVTESENGYYGLALQNATITLGEGTAITATLTGEDNLSWTRAALLTDNVTIKGKGSIIAESKCGYPGLRVDNTLTLDGSLLEAIGGPDKVGARVYGTLVFGDNFKQLKVKTGQTGASPIYIHNSATDAELVIDETKLTETKKDGYRTITPKPAAE